MQTAIGQAKLSVRVRKMLGIEEDPNIKVGINGFGRLGRLVFRAIMDLDGIDVVSINDPYIDAEYMAYMLQHDELFGSCRCSLDANEDGQLVVDGHPITILSCREPREIDWYACGAVYVIEASGRFDTPAGARAHLTGGAKHVIVAAPCGNAPQLIVGVNHDQYRSTDTVVSGGSPAAHCLAMVAKVVDEAFGIEHASVNVLQACRKEQLDQVAAGPAGKQATDWRSGRGGGIDVIPTAAECIEVVCKALPGLDGRLGGAGYRVPGSSAVSLVDVTIALRRPATMEQLGEAMSAAASVQPLRGRLGYRMDDVNGGDFVADGRSAIFDRRSSIGVSPSLVKVVAWFPGAWPYARRIVELLLHMHGVDHGIDGSGTDGHAGGETDESVQIT